MGTRREVVGSPDRRGGNLKRSSEESGQERWELEEKWWGIKAEG